MYMYAMEATDKYIALALEEYSIHIVVFLWSERMIIKGKNMKIESSNLTIFHTTDHELCTIT